LSTSAQGFEKFNEFQSFVGFEVGAFIYDGHFGAAKDAVKVIKR
jgi:hypothetical protein